jgi:butyryl-CoA dehydrogenase
VDFTLSDEQTLIREMTREFAAKEIAPRRAELLADAGRVRALAGELASMGYMGMLLSPEHGGGGVDLVSFLIAVEELARVDAGIATAVVVANALAGFPIERLAPAEAAGRLSAIASGQVLVGALVAGDAGAPAGVEEDGVSLVSTAGGLEIDGRAEGVSFATVADAFVVHAPLAAANGGRGRGIFFLERDATGLSVEAPDRRLGFELTHSAGVRFRGCRLSGGALLARGTEAQAEELDGVVALSAGARCLGIAEAAFAAALEHARERVQFKQPIAELPPIQRKIADMRTEIDAARWLLWRAAWSADGGLPHARTALEARLFAAEAGTRVTHSALQIFGGYGCMEEYAVARHYRDARVAASELAPPEDRRLRVARSLVRDGVA